MKVGPGTLNTQVEALRGMVGRRSTNPAARQSVLLQVLLKVSVVLDGTWYAHKFDVLVAPQDRKANSAAQVGLTATIHASCVTLGSGEPNRLWWRISELARKHSGQR